MALTPNHDCPDRLVDIYTLGGPQWEVNWTSEGIIDSIVPSSGFNAVEGTRCSPDKSNLISITVAFARKGKLPIRADPITGQSQLTCQSCRKATRFLYDSSIGYVCPPCLHARWGYARDCPRCGRKIGCDSCGGVADVMIEADDNLLLCAQDRCAMPFGYYIQHGKLVCSCERDIIRGMGEKLLTDLIPIVEEMIVDPPNAWSYWREQSVQLGDLSMSRADRCLPCQISRKYVRACEFVQGDAACNCRGYAAMCGPLRAPPLRLHNPLQHGRASTASW